jgi:sulfur carrier protein ThiS
MQIKVSLHGSLRKKLSSESRGRTMLDMAPGSTIADVLTQLDITRRVICTMNNQIEHDFSVALSDGDDIQLLLPVGGGQIRFMPQSNAV